MEARVQQGSGRRTFHVYPDAIFIANYVTDEAWVYVRDFYFQYDWHKVHAGEGSPEDRAWATAKWLNTVIPAV